MLWTSMLLMLLSLLTASLFSIATEFGIGVRPTSWCTHNCRYSTIPVMCADESICWIENRISPHWQLHFHHEHCTCTYMLCELLTYRYVLLVVAGKIFPTFLTWCTFVFQISKWTTAKWFFLKEMAIGPLKNLYAGPETWMNEEVMYSLSLSFPCVGTELFG